MFARLTTTAMALIGSLSIAGCSGVGGLPMTTGSLNNGSQTTAASSTKLSPVCVALIARIDGLRREGTPERIKKVSEGKTTTAVVKRSALAKIAQLNRANAEYQANCSSYSPTQLRAAAKRKGLIPTATAPATQPTTKKKTAAVTPVSKKKTATPTTTTVRKPAVVVPTVKNATAPTAPVAAVKKQTTVITKKATPVGATPPAPVTGATSPTATTVKKAATAVSAGAQATATATKTATQAAAEAAAKKAKAAAAARAQGTVAKATTPTAGFPPAGTSGIPMEAGNGVVVTTTVP